MLELLIVLAIVAVLAAVLVPQLTSSRRTAQYRAAEVLLTNLAKQIVVCTIEPGAFFGEGGFPADVGPSTPPPGCPEVDWPARSEVPFESTIDYENWDLGGERWIGLTFWGEYDSRSTGANVDLGPGLRRWPSGGNITVSVAILAP